MPARATILNVGVIAALPLLLVALVVLWRGLEEKGSQTAQEREARARVAALTAEAFLSGNLTTVRSVALGIPLLDVSNDADIARLFERLIAENTDWQGASIIGTDGWNRVSSTATPPHTIFVGDRPYFQRTLATGQSVVSTAIIGRASGLPTVVLTSLIVFRSGEPGVLVAPLPTSRLAETLHEQVETDTIRVVLVDASGQTIVDPDPDRVQQLVSLTGDPSIDAALAGRSGSHIVTRNGVESLVAYAPVPGYGWGVLVVEPTATAFAAGRRDALQWLALVVVSVLLVLGISRFFSRRLADSFRREVEARTLAEHARTEAELARQHATFLGEAGSRLAATVEYEPTLAALVHLAVPALADWCVVDVVDDQGRIQRRALAHEPGTGDQLGAEVIQPYATTQAIPEEIADVLQSRRGRIYDEHSGELLLPGGDPARQRDLVEDLGLGSAMVLPLVARDQTLGVLTMVSTASRRNFEPDDLAFATRLAGRAAMFIYNARLYEEVQLALRTRDEFLASASHDLRSPLSAIKAMAQLLHRHLLAGRPVSTERVTASLANIVAVSDRMAVMIQSLMDLTQLQMGQPLELERAPTDLVNLVTQAVTEVQETTDRHRIELETIPTLVGEWDAARLERVVRNLLENAVKYSVDDDVIELRLAREDDGESAAVLTVHDHGIGIPPEDLPRIFDRFQRGSNVVGKIAGTGIGLAGARQIVEQHGGTITVSSEVRRGTTVTVRLPLTPRAQQTAGVPENASIN